MSEAGRSQCGAVMVGIDTVCGMLPLALCLVSYGSAGHFWHRKSSVPNEECLRQMDIVRSTIPLALCLVPDGYLLAQDTRGVCE